MTRQLTWLATISIAALVVACGGRQKMLAKPSAGDGVSVELREYDIDDEDIEFKLAVNNQTGYNLVVDRNQIAVVMPNGSELRADRGRNQVVVDAGRTETIGFSVEGDANVLQQAPGFWLRFDGIYMGDNHVAVPPLALGAPAHAAGQPTEFPVPQLARDEYSGKESKKGGVFADIGRGIRSAVGGGSKKSSGDGGTATDAGGGLQEYRGVRQKIKTKGLKVAAMPLKAVDVPKKVAFIMDELLLTELQTVGFEAIGPDDINAMVGFEGMKDQMGCDDAACVAEIGNALGVPYLTAGNIATVEGSTVLTLKLIDVRNTTVKARVSKMSAGDMKVLPRVIAEAVQEMVKRSEL